MNRAIADGMTQIENRRREEWERHRNVPLDVDVVSRYAANFCAESFENEEGRHLDESLKSVARDRIIKWYVRASLLAKRHQVGAHEQHIELHALRACWRTRLPHSRSRAWL